MKFNLTLLLSMLFSVHAYEEFAVNTQNVTVGTLDISWIAGNLLVGAIMGTQSDIFNTQSQCYNQSLLIQEEIDIQFGNGFDFQLVLDRAQLISIKFQQTINLCSLEIMLKRLDTRMSELDFTLGLITNVFSQIMGGIQTQDWENKSNSNQAPFYIAFNDIYIYQLQREWQSVGRYAMLFLVGLLNFQSPNVNIDLGTF